MTEKIEQVPAIGISYKIPMPVNKELVFQVFVDRSMPVEELNEILDKVRLAGQHQCKFARQEQELARAYEKVAEEEKNIEWLEDQIGQLRSSAAAALERFEKEKSVGNGRARMRDADQATVDQARDKYRRYEEDIVVRKQRLADTRKALDGWL